MKRFDKTLMFDVHSELSQLAVADECGEVLLEMQVRSVPEEMRRVVGGISGRKRVIMEQGPLSGTIHDALEDLVEEIVVADPTKNALIACAEDSSDERDALRLGVLDRANAIHGVFVPPEPHRTLRSLLCHDHVLANTVTSTKNRLKGLLRRHAIPCSGTSVYQKSGRKEVRPKLPNAQLRWQLDSLGRQLDQLRNERVGARRTIRRICTKLPQVRTLRSIPGFGAVASATFVAWIVRPERFSSLNKLSSYCGLGLGQGFTNWKPIGRSRASKRGNREVKLILFIAARSAVNGDNAFSRRYEARLERGWPKDAARRDIARKMAFVAAALMRTGRKYDDRLVNVPTNQ